MVLHEISLEVSCLWSTCNDNIRHGKLPQDQMITVNRKLYSLHTALEWSLQIAVALRYLHRCKPPVVHRDLKLENVILSHPLQPKRSFLFGSRSKEADDASLPGTCAGERGVRLID